MTRYAFYLELTPPVFTVDAESLKDAQKKADEMIANFDKDIEFKVTTNLYADEFWELKEE